MFKAAYTQVLGLKDLHDAGIMHRDMKPENILISPLGHMTISDFGLAWMSMDHELPLKCFKVYELVGTPGYLAPEILSPRMQVDGYTCSVDVFSLGLVFLELFTGFKEAFWNARTGQEQWRMMRDKVLDLDRLVEDRDAMDLLCEVSMLQTLCIQNAHCVCPRCWSSTLKDG